MNATTQDPPLLLRLRTATRLEHDAMEAALDLMSDRLTLADCRRTLERFYGFCKPREAGLVASGAGTATGLCLVERLKPPLLDEDVRALGADPDTLPTCPDLPPHDAAAQALGCLYVLEGARLGGQLITRHVRRALGVTPERGGRFFHGYGDRSRAMWESFRSMLAALAVTPTAQDEVVAAAYATFRSLRRWCQSRPIP